MGWRTRRYGNPDRNQQTIVDYVRGLVASVENTTGVGKGFPDLVIGFRRLTVLAEIKRQGRKADLRESQEDFNARWQGGPILLADSGDDLARQLIDLDRRTPPVRGVTDRWQAGTAQAILADCLEATGGAVTDPDGLPAFIRACLEGMGGYVLPQA